MQEKLEKEDVAKFLSSWFQEKLWNFYLIRETYN